MANRAHEPTSETRKAVAGWARDGVSQEVMAEALGISVETLVKYYGAEVYSGRPVFKAKFAANLNSRLLAPKCHPALLIFMAKVLLGYRETTAVDPDAKKPVQELTNDQLREKIAAEARARRQAGGGGPGVHRSRTRDAAAS